MTAANMRSHLFGRDKVRRRSLVAFAIVLALSVTSLFGGLGATQPAQAAVLGHYIDVDGFLLGNFLSSDGKSYVYCIEPGAGEPSSPQQTATRMDTLPSYTSQLGHAATGWVGTVWDSEVSGDELRQMNYIMWQYGRTADADQAAAVQFALWLMRRGPGTSAWLDHHTAWLMSHGQSGLVSFSKQMVAEAKTKAQPEPAIDPAPLSLESRAYETNEEGAAVASGKLRYPSHTSKLKISGGTFANGARSVDVEGAQSGSQNWQATLHADGWERYSVVTIEADWRKDVVAWPAEVVVHPPSTTNQQFLGAGISPISRTQTKTLEPVTARIDTQFSPVLSTQVPEKFVQHGGLFADSVSFQVAAGSPPWATRVGDSGSFEFAPVRAEGVLYGPFAHAPSVSDEIPANAPVAARSQVTASSGPGSYPVKTDAKADESGYYTWVWSINEDKQQETIREAELLPGGYEFRDAFGVATEGQLVPTRLRWNTELLKQEIYLEDMQLIDSVTAHLQRGSWLRGSDGERIPAILRLTVFQTDERPVQQETPPSDAQEIASNTVTLTSPDETVTSKPMPLDFETRGWVTVRSCLAAADQPDETQGHIEEWCDDFGVAAETAEILPPEVRTEAQPQATIGETIRDTAIVSGRVPKDSSIGFTFYLAPKSNDPKFDAEWKEIRDEQGDVVRWTAEEIEALSANEQCLAQAVATTERVQVTAAGNVESPEVLTRSSGVGYWVEDLATTHPETGEPVELHRGGCGIAAERTEIIKVPMKPKPKQTIVAPAPGAPKPNAPQPEGLAVTGANDQWAMAGGVLIAGVGLLLAAVGALRQRNRYRTKNRCDGGATGINEMEDESRNRETGLVL